jgi:hypothetical protein
VWLAQSQRKPLPGIASLDWRVRPKDVTYPVPIGLPNTGDHVWMSLFDTSHVLVGGESRSGKPTWAHAMLCGMLPFCTPDTLTLALLDAKGVEFSMWKHVPHLVAPICKRADQADVLLTSIAAEMDRREVLFDQHVDPGQPLHPPGLSCGQPGALAHHPGCNVNGRGAHQLPRSRRGRFMARLDGDLVEMQGYCVGDDLIRKVNLRYPLLSSPPPNCQYLSPSTGLTCTTAY